ncbi:MAG: lecithin retinol acyltransferase family protein [Cyanobacteriota bacterium]|nr:lecithin retinol acyltransferase family protein [Cyanobacteriota bacterium]
MAAADHLQVPRQHGLFNHHGIDLGDGTVAHYLEGREILRSPWEEFSRGLAITTVDYPPGSCSPTGVTVRRAMGRLGEQNYNLLFNNCEHFAHWCKTGRHRSNQVEDWLHTSSLGALAIGQFIPAAVLTGARMLLRHGITVEPGHLEKGRELALKTLGQLDGLRSKLQIKLEEELAKAEARWAGPMASNEQLVRLRLTAQNLADQLTEVEEIEAKLETLLSNKIPTTIETAQWVDPFRHGEPHHDRRIGKSP